MLPHQQIVDIHRDGRLKRVSGSHRLSRQTKCKTSSRQIFVMMLAKEVWFAPCSRRYGIALIKWWLKLRCARRCRLARSRRQRDGV